MPLYKDPVSAIFAAIQEQNNLVLVPNEYTLSNPTAILAPEGDYNTEITLTAASPSSPYEGSVVIQYRRLDLADLATFLPQPIRANGIATMNDVADVLNKQFGFAFVHSDLVAGNVTSLTNDNGDITIVAAANSKFVIGQVTLSFIKGDIDIDQVMEQKVLPGLLYPAADETKSYGQTYSYWRDFTSQKALLENLIAGESSPANVAAALTAVTNHQWVTVGNARYSLQGAVIAYNGITEGRTDVNPSYERVMIVTLGAACLGYSGKLVLHYGLASDGIEE